MSEIQSILDGYEAVTRAGREAVLATVLRTTGSTYRKAGARMLMTEGESIAGAISGGCLEDDLVRKAWWRTAERGAAVVHYDGAAAKDEEEDAVRWGFGLGCDGSLDVLVERLRPADPCNPILALRRALEDGALAVLATVLAAAPGARAAAGQRVLLTTLDPVASTVGGPVAPLVLAEGRRVLEAGAAALQPCTAVRTEGFKGHSLEVAYELLLPPRRLALCGSNYDVVPVAHLARELGWAVTFVEPRPSHALRARRLAPHGRVLTQDLEVRRLLASADERSAVVLMSHHYDTDRAMLRAVLGSRAGYVGLLGPRRRTDRMLLELEATGRPVNAAERGRLRGPVGLPLGGHSPEAIALSIVAELQAFASGASRVEVPADSVRNIA